MLAHDFENSYYQYINTYENVALVAAQVLRAHLDCHQIAYIDIPTRIKSMDSAMKKFKSKNYHDITQLTDLIGIRVIALVEKDLNIIENIVRDTFVIHDEASINKSALLGTDRFGYRSIHYICSLNINSPLLSENFGLASIRFEVQLRTALAHTWAEIEHKGSYKQQNSLPEHLKRRFSLLSGLLEAADLEFNRLTEDIDRYYQSMNPTPKKVLPNKMQHTMLMDFIHSKIHSLGLQTELISIDDIDSISLSKKLHHFDIHTIDELNTLFDYNELKLILQYMEEYQQKKTLFTLLSSMLIKKNPRKYLAFLNKQQLTNLLTTPQYWQYYQTLTQLP